MDNSSIKPIDFGHFPTLWQAVVFRNYGKVSNQNLAHVLGCAKEDVERAAVDLGIDKINYQSEWRDKGYISLIRNNWYLLNYPQLNLLLDMTQAELDYILKEDDFLYEKLGGYKPDCKEVKYLPLTDEERAKTAEIKKIVLSADYTKSVKYFDFFSGFLSKSDKLFCKTEFGDKIKNRILYSYSAVYGDPLLEGDFSSFPKELLIRLKKLGVNGLWIQGLLYQLCKFPFDDSAGKGYITRIKNLNKLIEYAGGFGIKIYLYLNEPRNMPLSFFERNPSIKGHVSGGFAAMCTSAEAVKSYLYNGVKYLAESAPGLGGIITITMSENLTHCYSKSYDGITNCVSCAQREKSHLPPEVNNIFKRALKDAGSNAELIGWNWGWSEFLSWTKEEELTALQAMDSDVAFMCVSEEGMELEKGGVKNKIIDYSVSNPGPSERTVRLFNAAKQKGHKLYAKTQINNSWECSPVPFIPVFELVHKHLSGLTKCGIDGIMLGWTLGGFPSFNLNLASEFYGGEVPDLDGWYKSMFGDDENKVKAASRLFSNAFTEFPFCLDFIYNGPQNAACTNLFFKEKTGLKATMVGYPFDDVDTWRGNYSEEQLLSQLQKLCDGWKKGLNLLDGEVLNTEAAYFKRIAGAVYCHFLSSLNLAKWSLQRDMGALKSEYQNTLDLLALSGADACLGFEASNHYYYCENTLLEKLINLKRVADEFKTDCR